jgi:transglutaminase-like putative cysteine protease
VQRLESVFQFSVFGLLGLASLMLAYAEGSASPVMVTIPLTVVALIIAERTKRFRLPLGWANGLGAVAFVLAVLEFLVGGIEARLLSGAHLLAYISWIILFQKKNPIQYWWMCALAVLQVALGAVLTKDGLYGALLVMFLFAAIWTLSVFSLYQARSKFAELEREPWSNGRRRKADRGDAQSSSATAGLGRPSFASLLQPSLTRNAIQHDSLDRWIGGRFVAATFVTTCLALAVAAAFFSLTPRLWLGSGLLAGDGDDPAGRPLTGFTEEVRLGDIGQILESTEPVLDVRVFDEETGKQLDIFKYCAQLGLTEPLFRGTVTSHYERGRWSGGDGRSRFFSMQAVTDNTPIRQEIRLQPIGTHILFAMHPLRTCLIEKASDGHEPTLAQIQPTTSVLAQPGMRSSREPISYSVLCPPPDANAPQVRTPRYARRFESYYLRTRYIQMPAAGLDRLRALAERVSGSDAATPSSHREMASRLETHLRDSGEFSYSLNASIRDPNIDPVEDFLFNRKSGHCEYYASALVLMLRAVDIPSRMVSGFKGGKQNTLTGAFEVEQRHAHAWVEAYLDGGWVVLDATPALARSESVQSMESSVQSWHDFTKLMSDVWGRHVLGVNFNQQRNEFYEPIRETLSNLWDDLKQGHIGVASVFAAFTKLLTSPDRWFSWQGGVVTFILLLLGSGLFWAVRRLAWQWKRFGKRERTRHRSKVSVEFYERFRRLCRACGLSKDASQTEREFVTAAARHLESKLPNVQAGSASSDLVEAFYCVRFGGQQLQPERAALVDTSLTRLEDALRRSR